MRGGSGGVDVNDKDVNPLKRNGYNSISVVIVPKGYQIFVGSRESSSNRYRHFVAFKTINIVVKLKRFEFLLHSVYFVKYVSSMALKFLFRVILRCSCFLSFRFRNIFHSNFLLFTLFISHDLVAFNFLLLFHFPVLLFL
jgi:hypothetical protein